MKDNKVEENPSQYGKDVTKSNIVKDTCKELGVTQKELAEMIGVTQSALSQWANNISPVAELALKLLVENKKLKDDLNIIISAHKTIEKLAKN